MISRFGTKSSRAHRDEKQMLLLLRQRTLQVPRRSHGARGVEGGFAVEQLLERRLEMKWIGAFPSDIGFPFWTNASSNLKHASLTPVTRGVFSSFSCLIQSFKNVIFIEGKRLKIFKKYLFFSKNRAGRLEIWEF